eukprot:ctg_818.g341
MGDAIGPMSGAFFVSRGGCGGGVSGVRCALSGQGAAAQSELSGTARIRIRAELQGAAGGAGPRGHRQDAGGGAARQGAHPGQFGVSAVGQGHVRQVRQRRHVCGSGATTGGDATVRRHQRRSRRAGDIAARAATGQQ